MLFSAIVGALSTFIILLITNAQSSLDAWNIIASTYANPSRGHVKQLQFRLRKTTKSASQSVTEHMQIIKTLFDELALLGKTTDPEDVTDIILHDLDPIQYKPIIDCIHARDSPISFAKLHENLLNQELSLQQNDHTTSLQIPAAAFASRASKPSTRYTTTNNNPGILPTPPSSCPFLRNMSVVPG